MRFSLILVCVFALPACSHQAEKVSSETTTVIPATYAMSFPADGQTMTPTNPCAENYGNVVGHLESLMQKKAE